MRYLFILIIGILFTVSCSVNKENSISNKTFIEYPGHPDTARIQFLTSYSSSNDIIVKKQSAFNKFVTGEIDGIKNIVKPMGLGVNNGIVYVADVGIKGINVIDLEKKTFEYFIPEGQGTLQHPIQCYVDDDDKLYVVDASRKQIVVFNHNKDYIGSFGEKENFLPMDVFVYKNKILVVNSIKKKIEVYNKANNKFLYSFPNVESREEGYLYNPRNVYVRNEIVYVTDFGGFAVNRYSIDGKYIGLVGGHGRNIGKFGRPKGIAVDNDDNLYALDATFENAQIFNKKGQLLLFFGGHYTGKKGEMNLPYGITIDYSSLEYFQKYVNSNYVLKYLIFTTNQVGPDKINVYGRVELKK